MRHFPFACAALLLVVVMFLITGCAHRPEERIVYREVKVPVRVDCLGAVPAPTPYAGSQVALDADILGLVIALLVERDQRAITETQLRAAMAGCQMDE